MLTIYLIRHGQDQDNAAGLLNGRRDTPLTALGLAQAHEGAVRIKALGISFAAILFSPLQRAKATAEVIAGALGLNERLQEMPSLVERDFGEMSGKPVASIEAMCVPDIIKTKAVTYFLRAPGAESLDEVLLRGKRVIEELKTRYADGNVLLVTHGDIGKMIFAAYYGLDVATALKIFHFGNLELFKLSPEIKLEEARVYTIKQHNA